MATTPVFLGFPGSSTGKDSWVGKIRWRREQLSTLVFWPREFHGLYSAWGHKESDTTGQLFLSPFPVFLSGKFYGQRSLVWYSPWGLKELDTTDCSGIFTILKANKQQVMGASFSQLLSRVRLFETPQTVAHQSPSVHGISQARILECVASSFSRGSSSPKDQTVSPALAGRFSTTVPPGKPGKGRRGDWDNPWGNG